MHRHPTELTVSILSIVPSNRSRVLFRVRIFWSICSNFTPASCAMPLHERLYLFQCEPQLLTLLDETDVVQITFRVNAVSGRRVQWLAQNSLGFFGRDSDFWLSNALILYLRMGLRIRRANRRTGRRIDWQMSMAARERGVP